MKEHLEKICLAVAASLLLGGIALSMTAGAGKKLKGALSEGQLQGPAYEDVVKQELISTKQDWSEAPYQDETNKKWQYAVFTPPKIWVHPESKELVTDYTPPPPPKPFGLALVKLEKPVYPISVTTFLESETGRARNANIILNHSEKGESSELISLGDKVANWDITIKAIRQTEKQLSDGTFQVKRIVEVIDKNLNKTMVLSFPNEPVYIEDELILELQPVDAARRPIGDSFTWANEGDSKQITNAAIESATFKLLKIDFDNQSVTVQKVADYLEAPKELTLSLQTFSTTIDDVAPESSAEDMDTEMNPPFQENMDFGDIFQ